MKNIGIFGIGCIGSILTKYLVQNKSNTYFYFNRSQKTEIRIEHKKQITTLPVQISNQIDCKLDWLIICLKEYQIQDALPSIKHLIHTNTNIAIFRNGIHLAEDFNNTTAPQQILETIIDCPTQQSKSGAYIQFKTPKIMLPKNAIANEFMELLSDTDIDWIQTVNFKTEQWKKLIESSSLGSIQALKMKPCIVFKDPKVREEYVQLINEGIVVARSTGIKIEPNFTEKLLHKLKEYPDSKGSSMLTDRLAGKQLELNAKIGAIVKIGLKNNIQIPTTQQIYNSLIKLA